MGRKGRPAQEIAERLIPGSIATLHFEDLDPLFSEVNLPIDPYRLDAGALGVAIRIGSSNLHLIKLRFLLASTSLGSASAVGQSGNELIAGMSNAQILIDLYALFSALNLNLGGLVSGRGLAPEMITNEFHSLYAVRNTFLFWK